MSDIAISLRDLSKAYRLGTIGYGTLSKDMQSLWAKARGKEDPNAVITGATVRENTNELFWALKNLTLDIKKGEIIGVIGHNGAGKSTLLKILSRITRPTEGYAEITGQVGSLLEVGTGFHPELTGRENIFLNGAILGMKKAEIARKMDEIIEFSGVEKFVDTPVKRYSSGMHVRLAFAVAAHLEPEIMIVDEVLAVGDASFQKKCLGKMEEVGKEEGRTILFVSHNMSAITRLCDRAILLESGKLIADGNTEDIVGLYLENVVSAGSTKEWQTTDEAPGTDELRLISVKAADPEGKSTPTYDIEKPLRIDIEYHVSKPGMKFRCAAILSMQGNVVFSTIEQVENERENAGRYRSTVTIPGNMLSEGEYTVGISIFASKGVKSRYVLENDVIAFQVYDPITGNSARGDYAERIGGVVRPLLPWTYEEIRNV